MPSYARKHQLQKSLVYHIYNRSHRGEFIFKVKEDFEHFAGLLGRLKDSYDIKIYHWVIMSNHFHLCVEFSQPEEMSRILAGVQRAYTHYYNRTHEVFGYLWQGRFKSQAIEKEQYVQACGRYIERNPVRAAMVREAEEYSYSSGRYYCLGTKDGITDANPFIEEFGGSDEEKRINYTRYLRDFDLEEEKSFRRMLQPLGSDAFKARLMKMGGHFLPRRRGNVRKDLICS